MIVGYARTSTWDQTAGLAAQQRDLKAAGAEKVFSEQASSVAQRTKLTECLAFLRDGDVLTVTKPDRLARSTAELLSIEADLTKRGIGLVVLSMGGERLDTRKPDQQAHADHPGRRGDMGARDHAGAAARGHRQGEGRRQVQGAPGQHRRGADQAAEGRVGSRGDRQEARHRPEFGLPRACIGSGIRLMPRVSTLGLLGAAASAEHVRSAELLMVTRIRPSRPPR